MNISIRVSLFSFMLAAGCASAAPAATAPPSTPTAATKSWPTQRACDAGNPWKDRQDCYYYIDQRNIEAKSYCLRKTGNHPLHVRKALTRDALLTYGSDGSAWFEGGERGGGYCAAHALDVAAPGDRFTLAASGSGDLLLTMLDGKATPPYSRSAFAVTLAPDPLAGAKHFYWKGTANNIDYFVMLADDKHGKMKDSDKADVKQVQQYYIIEAFSQAERDLDCLGRRPDKGASAQSIPQFSRWKSHTATCTVDADAQENGTGSGGHDFP
jgi:hypothetical protein